MLILDQVLENLNAGKIILYPTDTVWGIGCDATNEEAVNKIYQLKKREESKSLIILVSSIKMLKEYVSEVPDEAIKILNSSKEPTTIIYNNPLKLAKNAIASDNTIAIRIPEDEFCIKMIEKFGRPVVSSSANISGVPTPKCFLEISKAILNNVDYTVPLHQNKINVKSSTILRIEDDKIKVIRG